ncbi:MAG: RNA 2',3'-cyclic phosphodiesterase, partial [Candidatus Bathyarchaeota archaeon]
MGVRCFVSVDVEDPGILDAIELVQGSLKATGADLKAVEKENIHLTLKFLGDVDEGTLEEMKGIISGIIFDPFWMELRGVGTFPNLRRPMVVWVGLTQGVEELRQIFERLEAGLTGLGFKPEKRRFSPQLTIARVRSGRNKI